MRVIKTGSFGTAEGSPMSLRLTNDCKPAALSPNSEKGRGNEQKEDLEKTKSQTNYSIDFGEERKRSTEV